VEGVLRKLKAKSFRNNRRHFFGRYVNGELIITAQGLPGQAAEKDKKSQVHIVFSKFFNKGDTIAKMLHNY
jgi:hypothetical protein